MLLPLEDRIKARQISGRVNVGPCICALPPRDDGGDPCLGRLPFTMNACCGHGKVGGAYIQFTPGVRLGGRVARFVQILLMRLRDVFTRDFGDSYAFTKSELRELREAKSREV